MEFQIQKEKPVKEFVDLRLYTQLKGEWYEVQQRPSAEEKIPRPPGDVFEGGDETVTEHLVHGTPQPLPYITRYEYPTEAEGGGMFVHYLDFKYPRRGFPFPEAVQVNNIAKRLLIGRIRELSKNPLALLSLIRRKNLNKFLNEMGSAMTVAFGQYKLKEFRCQKPVRELRKFLNVFLEEIGGISKEASEQFSKYVSFLFEWDDAYLLILQDLLSETTEEKLSKSPAKELARLLKLFKERDPRPKMQDTMGSSGKLLSLAFFYPGVKLAFRKALKAIEFEKLQMDDGDKYWALRWLYYNSGGVSFDDRIKKFMEIHEGVHPRMTMLVHNNHNESK